MRVTVTCPKLHVEGTFKLGQWVSVQRMHKDTCPLNADSGWMTIGFVWDALEEAWEEGFAALMIFKAREGHCRVPTLHVEGTFKLGQWVTCTAYETETHYAR